MIVLYGPSTRLKDSVKNMLRKVEAQYWIKLAENSSNQILGKSKNTRTGPLQGTDNNVITDDEQKADLLNKSFLLVDISTSFSESLYANCHSCVTGNSI